VEHERAISTPGARREDDGKLSRPLAVIFSRANDTEVVDLAGLVTGAGIAVLQSTPDAAGLRCLSDRRRAARSTRATPGSASPAI